jgi:hypothetical protein
MKFPRRRRTPAGRKKLRARMVPAAFYYALQRQIGVLQLVAQGPAHQIGDALPGRTSRL